LILEWRARPEPRVESTPAPVTVARPKTVVPEPQRVLSTTQNDIWDVRAAHRNLFSYADAAKSQPKPAVVRLSTPPPVPTNVVAPVTSEAPVRREPELSFHYVGSFGRASDPIAVFTRDGEVVNARAGDTVEAFRVEHVQFKGVEVRAPGADSAKTLPNRR